MLNKFRLTLFIWVVAVIVIFVICANGARVDSARYQRNITTQFLDMYASVDKGIESVAALKYRAVYDEGDIVKILSGIDTNSESEFLHASEELRPILSEYYYEMHMVGIDVLRLYAADGSLLADFTPDHYSGYNPDVFENWKDTEKNTKCFYFSPNGGVGLTFNYPIYWEGGYVGTIAFGITPLSYLKILKRFSDMDSAMLIKLSKIKGKVSDEGVIPKDQWLSPDFAQFILPNSSININAINRLIKKEGFGDNLSEGKNFFKSAKFDGKEYEAIFMPIECVEGNLAGYIVRYGETQVYSIINSNMYNGIIAIICVTLVLITASVFFRGWKDKDSMSRLLEGYHKAIDKSSTVIITDASGDISYLNTNFSKVSGYNIDDFLHKPMLTIGEHCNDSSGFKDMLFSVSHKRQWMGRLEFRRNPSAYSGTIFSLVTLDITAVPIVDSLGKVIETIFVMHDVTSLTNALKAGKEAEVKLNETLGILSATILASANFMVVINRDMEVAFSNWTGYDHLPKHIKNSKPYCFDVIPCGGSIFKVNSPECRCDACYARTIFLLKKHITIEIIEEEKDIYKEMDAYPIFDNEGEVTLVVSILRDIKERAMAERNLKAASRAQEVVAAKLKETVNELEISKAEAEKASKAKSLFLANMSHEIRTPINGIVGFLKLLNECHIDSTAKEYLEIVNASTSSLVRVINDVLDFSKIESGKMELEFLPFEPAGELEPIADMFGAQAEEKGIYILFFMDPSVPSILKGDALRIRQVLINLVSNAVKFTPQGGSIRLEIRSDEISESKCRLMVSVTDTGIGMDENVKKKIFDAFDQGDNSVTRRFGGTGLGLAISNSLLKLMGSYLRVESSPDEGSRFWFNLELPMIAPAMDSDYSSVTVWATGHSPIMESAIKYFNAFNCSVIASDYDARPDAKNLSMIFIDFFGDKDEFKKNVSAIRSEYSGIPVVVSSRATIKKDIEESGLADVHAMRPLTLSRIRSVLDRISMGSKSLRETSDVVVKNILFSGNVLVADDNEINLKLADIILRSNGLDVTLARNGVEAIELCSETAFDIIFMDIHMPIMDGMAATKKLRENGVKTPIVALTANVIKDDVKQFMASGMDNYLSKPINVEKLKEILAKYLKLI